MILNILILIVSVAMIVFGADLLTDGASNIARRLHVPELLIGLTVVAFGTSMPEMVVSVISGLEGKPELAIGNVVGSNLANTLVILGATALICPITISKQAIGKDIPWSIIAALLLLISASGAFINGDVNNEITRQSGLMMLCVFAIFLYYTILTAMSERKKEDEKTEEQIPQAPVWKILLFVALGLTGLLWGGQLFVDSASSLAFMMGWSESLVGLTIVALGTSAPELATSIVAALKNKSGLAIGNAVGSNIFNILLILGVSSTVTPLKMGNITYIDLLMQFGCSILLWVFARTDFKLTRKEGITMLLIYFSYMTYLILQQ